MATFGRIEEYTESENWSQYIERLGYYFEANSITEAEKKRSIFLTVCGSKCYGLIRNLLSPTKPDEKTFEELSKFI